MLTRRRFLVSSAAAGGLLLLRAPGAQAAPPAAPRLAPGPDAARSMWLSWSTPPGTAGVRADIGVDDSLGRALDVETRPVVGHDGVRYHHALADGLDPATTYRWRIAHDGADAATGSFTTAPVERVAFRFAAFGDQGDSAAAAAVGGVLAALDPAPAVAFLVGDLSYADKTGGVLPSIPGVTALDHAVWDGWLDLASAVGGARFPWLGGVGNHEMETGQGELGYDGYLARVALPGNGPDGIPTAWTARFGNVAFVNLDANDVSLEITRNLGWTGGAQTEWLASTLADVRADPGVDWIVVGFHHCAYCSNAVHASDGGVRDAWEPLFDEFGVDLVVNGHNHCYERSHPLRGGAPVAEAPSGSDVDAAAGTTYVTAGGGGQAAYPTFLAPTSYVSVAGGLRLPELATWSAIRSPANSFTYADVDPGTPGGTTSMRVVALDSAGVELERFTLVRARADAAVPAVPAAPAGPAAPAAAGAARTSTSTVAATGGAGVGAAAALSAGVALAAHRAVTREA